MPYICVPMMARRSHWIFHLRGHPANARRWEQLAETVANIRPWPWPPQPCRNAGRQSIRDPLTGLFNRRYMEEFLDRELRRLAPQAPRRGLMLDLDLFKVVTTLRPQGGDEVL
jgi:GGDEF domain-containing protein